LCPSLLSLSLRSHYTLFVSQAKISATFHGPVNSAVAAHPPSRGICVPFSDSAQCRAWQIDLTPLGDAALLQTEVHVSFSPHSPRSLATRDCCTPTGIVLIANPHSLHADPLQVPKQQFISFTCVMEMPSGGQGPIYLYDPLYSFAYTASP